MIKKLDTQPAPSSIVEQYPFGEERSTFPPGRRYSPELLEDAEQQLRIAWEEYDYQLAPNPSFENTPRVDITPTFNPSNMSEADLYQAGRCPERLKRVGWLPHSEHAGFIEPTSVWRIVERDKLRDGTGIVSSAALVNSTLGDIEDSDTLEHLASTHEIRINEPSRSTPFVSFTTDPVYMAKTFIGKYNFGSKNGRDSVIVEANVLSNRFLSRSEAKEGEVLLLGGLAPTEYVATYEISDFVETALRDPVNP